MCIHSQVLSPETCSMCKGLAPLREQASGHDSHAHGIACGPVKKKEIQELVELVLSLIA